MDTLENKYRKDALTPSELQELRSKVNSMSDNELGEQMYQSWMNGEIDCTFVEDQKMNHMKDNIDRTIGKKHSIKYQLIHFGQTAAAILLPVFIILSAYLYNENRQITSDEMIVSTGIGERANVSLPDGTTISLNSESKLSYLPKTYNRKERNISFNGEGYFQVYKNKEVPFIINSKGLQVKVLGTTFNLYVRESSRKAELALEEGSVWLQSTKSSKNVVLHQNQKAIIDQSTGNITVIEDKDIKKSSAWRQGDMIFRNTPLSDVLQVLEENYSITFRIDCKSCLADKFTGTLPTTDLNEVLEVIEKSYHLKAEISGNVILLTD
ncbi:FecR domain-containing protein [uncultured Bacteroides sp.]|uniref:FecR family protein n=1 Tax=uncultured Bacteroides sp. TaxID=162156 RepID=UPI0025CD0439|nr:FecR domain-containing protein [uncultured Bacteroides sp.]